MSEDRKDPPVEERLPRGEWIIQRIGWALWFGVLVAASLGLTGHGWLSERTLGTEDGSLTLEYERYLHHGKTAVLTAMYKLHEAGDNLSIDVDEDFLCNAQVVAISPAPLREISTDFGVSFVFPRTTDTGRVTFHMDFDSFGERAGRVRIAGHEAVTINQFVYP